MDASGKDGVVRKVFGAINPNGCSVKSFKKPTDEEYAHDFLWRVHAETPANGMIKIFNRSHYEDILVPSVYGFIPKEKIEKRFKSINDFEQNLENSGTRILKFFLNVSKEEQEVRLKERIENPEKHWKHNDGDWETRKHWDEFQGVYTMIFSRCDAVPWHNIPADKNWYKEYLVAEKVLETLKEINPQWPELDSEKY
jgi:PPK2 family polyphosphate:nucleotide phosphotransferase